MATNLTTQINPPPYFNKPAFERDGMQYVRLGSTGAVVSRICLGLMSYAHVNAGDKKWHEWMLNQDESEPFVKQALDAGINFFDTAEVYTDGRSEEFFGNALKKFLPHSKFTREDLVISTKILPARTLEGDTFGLGIQKGLSRKAIFAAVEGSLKRLQLDYIDLYFIHRYDPSTSPEETMRALHDLVQAGKIRYLGASQMYMWQFAKLQRVAELNGWTKLSVMQNHYNAIYREDEREMIPYCLDSGVACMPYSPLAAGLLCRDPSEQPTFRSQNDSIQMRRYHKNGDDDVIRQVLNIAEKRGVPAAQVALAFVLHNCAVAAPIIGATKLHHIQDAVKALTIQLNEEEVKRIEIEYQAHQVPAYNN